MTAPVPHTREKLAADLRALGVAAGDTLFVHSSFKSLGPVEGGAATVVAAFEEVLGAEGLLLMPSFNLKTNEGETRASTWNIQTRPSSVGWLTEFFRQMPGTYRSDHFSHSVAARGKGAREIVADHLSREGPSSIWDDEPWGKAYGTNSPMMRAYRAGGKLLMLGVDYGSSTYMHVIEVFHWAERCQQNPKAEFCYIGRRRPVLGEYWDSLGRGRRGKVGNADCRLANIPDFVDTLLVAVRADPQKFYSYWPD